MILSNRTTLVPQQLPATATLQDMPRPRRAPGPQPASPEVMTISELAEYLQVSKSSLYKLAQEGRVPGKKVGRHWRFHRETIEAWLKEAPNR